MSCTAPPAPWEAPSRLHRPRPEPPKRPFRRPRPLRFPQLTEKAAARAAEEGIAQQDALLKELLHWFKHEFFQWARSSLPVSLFLRFPSHGAAQMRRA